MTRTHLVSQTELSIFFKRTSGNSKRRIIHSTKVGPTFTLFKKLPEKFTLLTTLNSELVDPV